LDLVFPNTIGKSAKLTYIADACFPKLLKKAGLPDIRFHDLRHTTAALLFVQGVQPKIVSEMLGHTQISITLDIYTHAIPSMQ
jgi:integrase